MLFGSSGRPAVGNKIEPVSGKVQVYNGRTYTAEDPGENPIISNARDAGAALKAGLGAAGQSPLPTGGAIGPVAAPPTVGFPGGPGGAIGPVTGGTSGTDAAMLRAKDRVGLTNRASLEGLRSTLGERGLLGGGVEGRQTEAIARAGQHEMADVSREAAIKESDQAQRNAELAYQGAITQRGQDITTRGQDINATLAREGRFQSQQDQMSQIIMDALRSQLY